MHLTSVLVCHWLPDSGVPGAAAKVKAKILLFVWLFSLVAGLHVAAATIDCVLAGVD